MIKRTYLFLFAVTCIYFTIGLFCCVFAQNISLPPTSSSVVLSAPPQYSNMYFINESNPDAEAYTEDVVIGGIPCRKIPAGKYLYLSCDRLAVPTSQNKLLIAVTYYGNSANTLWFNYNSTTNNYEGADFQKVKTNQWVTAIVIIPDAAFNGQMNGGTDFRMGFNAEDNYIKEIKVYKGTLDPLSQPIPGSPGSSISEFKDKSFAGYQIWHKAGTDAADWVHWSYGVIPGPGFHVNEDIASFPDLSTYSETVTYSTNFENLGNGNPTRLYNDADATVINRQMNWLKTAGMDGVAIQRFVGPIGRNVMLTSESHLTNVKEACEATGRLFYICYDLNGADATILQRLQMDWVYEIEQMRALTSSPNYATVNGRPVVEMWGIGYDMIEDKQTCLDLITFFQSRGCYVIGGTPRGWRTNAEGANPNFTEVYEQLDAVSPWTVGVYNNINGANDYLINKMVDDKSYCDQHEIDYLPVVFAGSANWLSADGTFSQTNREGGKLLWQQVLNAKSIGLTSVYFAMLDEFEESTNLINGAVDYFDIPTDQYFETFSKDGIWTSSDYYLRLAARASRMLRGEIPTSDTIKEPYSNGPVYFRNSFESREMLYNMNGATTTKTLKIDPCFYHPSTLDNEGVNAGTASIIANPPSIVKTGRYCAEIKGESMSALSAKYYYQMSETKIEVKANMQLSFWKYAADELGQYTSIDLLFQSGKRLKDLSSYVDQVGYAMTPTVGRGRIGTWQQFTCQIGKGELIGDVVIGILIGYDHPSDTGNFTAYFDDILIEFGTAVVKKQTPYEGAAWNIPGLIEAEYYDNGGEGLAYHDTDEENKFHYFRTTEAVDVEATSDAGEGYNVGWIETGEWMEYTVDVQTAGSYDLEVRVASQNSGLKILHVEMDSIDVSGPVSFNSANGWQTYESIEVHTQPLMTGTHVMRVFIDQGGFNLNYVRFSIPLATSFNNSSEENEWTLYPNPVQRGTRLNWKLNAPVEPVYEIRLYDSNGLLVWKGAGQSISSNGVSGIIDLPATLSGGQYWIVWMTESHNQWRGAVNVY